MRYERREMRGEREEEEEGGDKEKRLIEVQG